MQVKIADGSLVELTAGESKVTLSSDVFGLGMGPFLVVGFEGNLPIIRLVEGEEPKDAPVDGGLIASVDNPEAELVPVTLSDGRVILVDSKIAPAIQAVVDVNKALEKALADLYSGDAVKKALEERDAAIVERDAALARVAAIGDALSLVSESVERMKVAFNG